MILLQITVTWNQGHNSVNETTAVNYPKPGLQTEGFLAVQLTNSGSPDVYTPPNVASDRLKAVPVSLQQTAQGNPSDPPLSPNPLTLHPDANGCVFAQVPTGSYTVSTGQPTAGTPSTFHGYTGSPPYVTTTGSTSDTSSTTVSITAQSSVQLTAFDGGITTSIAYGASSGVDQGVTSAGHLRGDLYHQWQRHDRCIGGLGRHRVDLVVDHGVGRAEPLGLGLHRRKLTYVRRSGQQLGGRGHPDHRLRPGNHLFGHRPGRHHQPDPAHLPLH